MAFQRYADVSAQWQRECEVSGELSDLCDYGVTVFFLLVNIVNFAILVYLFFLVILVNLLIVFRRSVMSTRWLRKGDVSSEPIELCLVVLVNLVFRGCADVNRVTEERCGDLAPPSPCPSRSPPYSFLKHLDTLTHKCHTIAPKFFMSWNPMTQIFALFTSFHPTPRITLFVRSFVGDEMVYPIWCVRRA